MFVGRRLIGFRGVWVALGVLVAASVGVCVAGGMEGLALRCVSDAGKPSTARSSRSLSRFFF
ncbi:hypothetical protein TFKS16_2786 [Tannerella forsythia KS16]|uniref:Uncharacterized protein n=1 Tax=Tannerella forsythia (strain ATCC 43037 / JCM 10827 / CCUG 21028 A / KCTC 5666 / FDC 338) TaxID=203275 RepID=G8UQB6_TANFA|nr:hypothetical protein BFO_3074 [Tannerella forsythia 92A2]BAR50127.1 hypothetical protein TF3313_2705 [Tannerella forsythia 3313]BAR52959.1 hypothetical protein TFKS16_2786 [Tannerella forsythia KS16]